jgi:hypothetical protein
MSNKIKVGDKLYAVLVNCRKYKCMDPKWVTITKVGRLYFESKDILGWRFRVSDMRVDGSTSNSYWKLYNSEEERAAEVIAQYNHEKVRKAFSGYGTAPFTDDQIARIVAIIEETKQSQ